MKSIKSFLLFVFATFIFCSTSYAKPLSDPFMQEWVYFDGVQTYKLLIRQSDAPGQDYHIEYTFPGGNASTDMCAATSSTSFHCLPGETVTRDDSQHAVKLETYGTVYVFYDPKFVPDISYIFGNWNYHYQKNDYSADYTISITKGNSDAQYNVTTGFKDSRGNHCSYDVPDHYQVTKNSDGTELISLGSGSWGYSFKFDPQKKQIVNPNPRQDFKAGSCVGLSSYLEPVVFLKG